MRIDRVGVAGLALVCGLAAGLAGGCAADERSRADALLDRTPLIDGHNDLPSQMLRRVNNQIADLDISSDRTDTGLHTDLPRLRAGGVGAQFWSVYIPIGTRGGSEADVERVFEQIDVVHRLAAMYPDDLEVAYTAADVVRIFEDGKVASLIGMEGGHSIGDSLAVLRATYTSGARYMTLTHSKSTLWADSATDAPVNGGLSTFGGEVVREMNRLGMLVDLSHVSPETMHDALDLAEAPVIFSHSSAKTITDHPRNVPDDVLVRLPENGGVVMVTFVPSYVSQALKDWQDARAEAEVDLQDQHAGDPEAFTEARVAWERANPRPNATIADVVAHINHIVGTAGVDHVGIGSDFDGIGSVPEGLEDVSTFPDLVEALLVQGYTESDMRKILGENVLRVMREAEAASERIRRERPAADARIEDIDS